MDKREVFSMIWRNGHSRNKAIRYISDFLQTDKKTAEQIYENEYLKEHPFSNKQQIDKNEKSDNEKNRCYKEAFKNKYSIRGILDNFRMMLDEY